MLFLGFICDEQHYGELVAYGDFPPLVPYGTTFPPLCGGTIKLRISFHSYVALK